MASPRSCRTRPATFLFVVTVILSLGATGALADLPATHLLLSELPLPAANDMFADATLITAFPFTDHVNNYSATVEVDEPIYYGSSRTVWYTFTPAESGFYQVDMYGTNSAYGPTITVYRAAGPTFFDLQFMAASEWGRRISWTADPATTYYVQVGSASWAEGGELIVNVDLVLPPSNDSFSAAMEIAPASLPFRDETSNLLATTEDGEIANCDVGRTVWYKFSPTATARYQAHLDGSTAYNPIVVVYRANGEALAELSYIDCRWQNYAVGFLGEAGVTYYLQVGNDSMWTADGGDLVVNLVQVPAPPNDNFANAVQISTLSFGNEQNMDGAIRETGEPTPSCAWNGSTRTIWYSYTPTIDSFVMAHTVGGYYAAVAGYMQTGSDFAGLTELDCAGDGGDSLFMRAKAGITYYFQVSGGHPEYGGNVTFVLEETPLPTADFYWNPWDPSRYDTVQFCDQSYDPVWAGWSAFWWDFGDGAAASGDYCTSHQYGADGDYAVWHKVQTTDGREAEVTKTVEVRTHDVAITKFAVPQSASAGQTRQITVGLRNYAYPEQVQVELYKSGPNGYEWIGAARQEVAVRSGNRTTDFKFSYTFTKDDASLGKVTFRAIATIQGPRDALPADNEAISSPCKVSGKK